MALDTYQDEYGNETAPNQGGGGGNDAAAKRRADIINGIIIPDYQKILGRAPDAAETEEAYALYEAQGGEAFRGSLSARAGNGKAGGGGFTWDASNFGAPPQPFGEQYSAGTYTPPQFTEAFNAPTADSLKNDPGYLARLDASQRGLERGAAANGSILSGGFIGRRLPQAQQEFASNEYGKAFTRAYDTYQQRYGMFSDAASRDANAFATNETGKLNQYSTRYKSYMDSISNTRNAENDRWQREMDLARLGLDSTTAGRP